MLPAKWSIFTRLTLGYLVIMLLVVVQGTYTTVKLSQLSGLTRDIDSVDGAAIRLIEGLSDAILSQVSFEKKYFLSKDRDFHQQFYEIGAHCDAQFKKLGSLMDSDAKQALFAQAQGRYHIYAALFSKEADMVQHGQSYPRQRWFFQKEAAIEDLNRRLREITDICREDRNRKLHASGRISLQVMRVSAAAAGLVILLGLSIAFLNTRSINRSILLLQEKTKEIARGRFGKIQGIGSPPEIKALADHFNTMSDRLQELDEMKIDFISHVSHELRTPLTAIKEASCMLLDGTYARHPAKQQELLTITQEECERLIDSVNRILDLSRMEAKMMEYMIRPCPLAPLIQRAILKLAPIAQKRSMRLKLTLAAALPEVAVDAERIEQVLENLIGNALKFSRGNDSVVVTAIVPDNDGDVVEVSVSDTGSGIASQHLEKIFDRFKRIERGRETERGTGLGLAIAKHIVTAHRGRIWAESQPGNGSTFFFTLPTSSSAGACWRDADTVSTSGSRKCTWPMPAH